MSQVTAGYWHVEIAWLNIHTLRIFPRPFTDATSNNPNINFYEKGLHKHTQLWKCQISQKTDITVLAQLECVKPDTLNCIGLYIKRKNLHFNCQITKQSQPNNEVCCSSCNRCFGLPSEFLNVSYMTHLSHTSKQINQICTCHIQFFE